MSTEKLLTDLRESPRQETDSHVLLNRGVETISPDQPNLADEINNRKLKLYLGIDPTSPDLHLGHLVPIRKLRQFQELGHEVVLLFGTFTGMIGDPTDKTSTRVKLTFDQIQNNIRTYAEQAGKVLDLSPEAANPITIKHNHEWLGKMNFGDVVDLASNVTVQQMEQRSMFQDRIEKGKPVWLHEFLYPLMQGWDSVEMGVDLEVGGKDQIFNMLVGRDFVGRYLKKEKWVMGTKLIEDPSGKKMGKTEGNIVNVNEWPEVKYEALMTWPDASIPIGFELLTSIHPEYIDGAKDALKEESFNPMNLKESLAYRVVEELDGKEAADYAEEEFSRVKRQKLLPRRLKEQTVGENSKLIDVLISSGLVKSEVDAMNELKRGSVLIDGKEVKKNIDWKMSEGILQIGRRTIKNIRLIKS